MRNVLSFLRAGSLLFFLGAMLLVYAYLPQEVALYSDPVNRLTYSMSKSNFFYSFLALVTVVNLLLYALAQLIKDTPVVGSGYFTSETFKDKTFIWLEVLICLVNVFFVASVAFLGIYNNQNSLKPENFAYLVYIGTIPVAGWLIFYIYVHRLRYRQPS